MTTFIKDQFTFDGMYLMYDGDQGKYTKRYGENGEKCHPLNEGRIKPMFIARFKYGRKPWKTWVNFIVKNFMVEELAELYDNGESPLAAMRGKGYTGK